MGRRKNPEGVKFEKYLNGYSVYFHGKLVGAVTKRDAGWVIGSKLDTFFSNRDSAAQALLSQSSRAKSAWNTQVEAAAPPVQIPSQTLTVELMNQVRAKVRECIKRASSIYGRTFSVPNIKFSLKGTVAGTANSTTYEVNFNSVLLVENAEKFLATTVPHEVAHLIDYILHPWTRKGNRRSVHGPTWKSVMVNLGVNPSRCHSYDVSNSRQRRTKRYVWACRCGCAQMKLTAQKHKKQLYFGNRYYMPGHAPSICGGYFFTGKIE